MLKCSRFHFSQQINNKSVIRSDLFANGWFLVRAADVVKLDSVVVDVVEDGQAELRAGSSVGLRSVQTLRRPGEPAAADSLAASILPPQCALVTVNEVNWF